MQSGKSVGGEPVVVADGVCVAIPEFNLTDVTFTVPRGVVMGVIGPAGCGKTVLLELLAGLLSHDDGLLRVAGVDPRLSSLHVKSRVGLATGHLRAWSGLTPMRILQVFADLNNVPSSAAQGWIVELVEELQLAEVANTPVSALPEDILMRVDVARALVHDPDLLLVDLGPSNDSPGFQILLRRLIRVGRSVVIACREHVTVEDVADCVIGLDSGRLMDDQALTALLGPPRRWRIRTPDPELALTRLPVQTVASVVEDGHLILDLRTGADRSDVLRELLRAGVRVDAYQPAEPVAEQRLREQELRRVSSLYE